MALGLALGGALWGLTGSAPEWSWVLLVLAVDVAHVWSTLFRTYLDPEELRRHPARYLGVPLGCYAVGATLYVGWGAVAFWRALAYLAVWHFVRQQVGWANVYRARGPRPRGWDVDRWVDSVTLYAVTLAPMLYWHGHLAELRFSWFVEGDFFDAGALAARLWPAARVVWALSLVVFVLRQAWLLLTERRLALGKCVMVAGTAACWWVGIVATNSDFAFTATNVLIHGVPYVGLLWAYTVARARERPESVIATVASGGVLSFLAVLLVTAFAEELLWDRAVWTERAWLFGGSGVGLSGAALPWLVPLLALPQSTHYALDALLWRRADTRARPAQQRAVGALGALEG